jgi:hypothetical protein
VRPLALATAAVLLGGCGIKDGALPDRRADAQAAAPTTVAPAPAGPLGDEPPRREDGPSGSGCAPGPASLPDGWWYGNLHGSVGHEVTFDLACYYIGAAAEKEAADRGQQVDDDFYIVNDQSTLRTLALKPAATAACVTPGGGLTSAPCSPNDVKGQWAVWLRVQNHAVDRIVEQYSP